MNFPFLPGGTDISVYATLPALKITGPHGQGTLGTPPLRNRKRFSTRDFISFFSIINIMVESRRTRVYPAAARTTFLVYGLIVSITIFFLAASVAYLSRFAAINVTVSRPPFPVILWFSTATLFLGSYFLRRAYRMIRRERQQPFLFSLKIACGLGGIFCLLQTIGMMQLLSLYRQLDTQDAGSIASILLLVLLHMVHFLAGCIALGFVTWRACRGRYDHEYYNDVKLAAVYWRFLDIVWILMLVMFWLCGH